jgi:hypothetical protein
MLELDTEAKLGELPNEAVRFDLDQTPIEVVQDPDTWCRS